MTTIHWQNALIVAENLIIDESSYERVPDGPGLYVFSRQYGDGEYEPFYVGIATKSLRNRLYQHFRADSAHARKIRNVLQGGYDEFSKLQVLNGTRYFHGGVLTPARGQVAKKALMSAERALIHSFLIRGYKLMNIQHNREPEFSMSGSLYGGLIPRVLLSPRR